MAASKPILIACPQHGKLVRGTYGCDRSGRYRLGPGGRFVLGLVRCGQDGGRCMQTLCALHRYNRGGPSAWYPGRILAAPDRKAPARSPRRGAAPSRVGHDGATDVVC